MIQAREDIQGVAGDGPGDGVDLSTDGRTLASGSQNVPGDEVHVSIYRRSSDNSEEGRECFVTSASILGSKVAWRVFEKDDTPETQDEDEVSIKFVHIEEYLDGDTPCQLMNK